MISEIHADPEICQAVLLDHYRHSPHRGRCEHETAAAEGGNPACGDLVRLSIEVAGDRIACARCDGAGCAISQAAASLAAAQLPGRTLAEARHFAALARQFLTGGPPTGTAFDVLNVIRSNPARTACALVSVRLIETLTAPG